MRECDIFIEVLESDPANRHAILADACGDDHVLRERVERLLSAHQREATFILDMPPVELEGTIETPLAERPGSVIGAYKLLQQIGEGGMGVVFLAEQTEPIQRNVAIKIIKAGMDTRQVIARFEAERQALAMMDHPNIARVLDAGTTTSGRPYFVMELVKGIPITAYCDAHKLSLEARLELFIPVCHAVQHAHQKGIIHRDIKPTNVLVAEYDDHAVPKVIDFGVAKATAQKLTDRTMFTEFGQVIGTVEYMSPEQAKFNQLDIDTRSDIYSLGVLLYELLTDSTPFERRDLREAAMDEVLRIIREEEPPKPSTRLNRSATLPAIAANRGAEANRLSKDITGELDWIVMKCLEKDRGRRYESASGLAEDIQHHLHDEAVKACPPSAAYRFRKVARRHKAAILTAAALVGLLLTLVVGLFASNRLIAASEREAQQNAEVARAEGERAEANLLRAVTAIREVLTKAAMGAGEWSELSPTLRKRFSDEAMKFYENMLQDSTNPNLQYETAVGLRAMGVLYYGQHELDKATSLLERSIALLEQVSRKYPDRSQYRHQLAWSNYNLARTQSKQRHQDKARVTLQAAVGLYEDLLVELPDDRDTPNELALCMHLLALIAQDQRDQKLEAESLNRESVLLEQMKISGPPNELEHQQRLTGARLLSAKLQAERGDTANAESLARGVAETAWTAYAKQPDFILLSRFKEAIDLLFILPSESASAAAKVLCQKCQEFHTPLPSTVLANLQICEQYGHVISIWGYHSNNAGDFAAASTHFQDAAEIFARLCVEKPDKAQNWHFRGNAFRLLGAIHLSQQQPEQAEQPLRQAIEFYERSVRCSDAAHDVTTNGLRIEERASCYIDLAKVLLITRHGAEARELIGKGVATAPDSLSLLKNAADVLATSYAGTPEDGREAVELARKTCEITNFKDASLLDTLAAAYAQAADFDSAVKWSRKSVELNSGETYQRHLELFLNKKPVRSK